MRPSALSMVILYVTTSCINIKFRQIVSVCGGLVHLGDREDAVPEGPPLLLVLVLRRVLLQQEPLRDPLLLPRPQQVGRGVCLLHAALPVERHRRRLHRRPGPHGRDAVPVQVLLRVPAAQGPDREEALRGALQYDR
ncbi:hypothetical protein AVEN_113575-1 [Araneus ventricosus]|uniref:Uncharacterized protein n=1 Tax=Araneus ventricosus TaxID=182803 RepID=A0A4Y2R3V7_ARAVE|nr:hypothetical protein AVEN_113575-1 [Araneus ventricosus]